MSMTDTLPKQSQPTKKLSNEENELIFDIIAPKCQSKCTTIAQLYQTKSPTHSHWIKKHTGVLCFVKDNERRSYYLQMFCLIQHELVWEQEIYENIQLSRDRGFLITFEGEVRLNLLIN